MKVKRVYTRVTEETAEKIDHWAEKLGLTKGQLYNMAILAGLDSIIRAIDPVSSLTPEQIAALVEKGIKFEESRQLQQLQGGK